MTTPTQTKFVTIRFPIELYNQIKALANHEHRSMSKQIITILQKATEK